MANMTAPKNWLHRPLHHFVFAAIFLAGFSTAAARSHKKSPPRLLPSPSPAAPNETRLRNDSLSLKPAKDLFLRTEGEHKAYALAHFVEGISFEENGEITKALTAYRKVLNVDPGQSELASRVAALLTRQEDFPQAIDVLKDTIKANPNAPRPFLQLALIYAKYLKRNDQAIDYANHAIALDPQNIEAYERLCEIAMAAGDEKKAIEALERAAKVKSDDGAFWTRLGKLYAAVTFKPDSVPKAEQIAQINAIFKKAAEHADDDPAILKDIADYYAASQQIREAIPIYLRLLELQPDDTAAQEKLANGFLLTNQRDKAVDMLEEIIKQHPEKVPALRFARGITRRHRALPATRKTDRPGESCVREGGCKLRAKPPDQSDASQHLYAPGGAPSRAIKGKRTCHENPDRSSSAFPGYSGDNLLSGHRPA